MKREIILKPDRYTKAVLTLIAISLMCLVFRTFEKPSQAYAALSYGDQLRINMGGSLDVTLL